MKLSYLLTLFIYCIFIRRALTNSSFINTKIIQEASTRWHQMANHMVKMIANSDSFNKHLLNVKIMSLEPNRLHSKYDGFYEAFLRYSDERWTVKLVQYFLTTNVDLKDDFLIILITDNYFGYESIIRNLFRFMDRSLKIFVVLSDYKSFQNLQQVWNSLTVLKYYNIYIFIHKITGKYDIVRTMMTRSKNTMISLMQTNSTKYFVMKDIINDTFPLKVVHYDTYPMSYVKDGNIIGADGYLLKEFCNKKNTFYRIINQPKSKSFSLSEVHQYLDKSADISLAKSIIPDLNSINIVWLSERDGLCLLVPRNIPVSAFENFKLPLDQPTLIMSLISTILVIICWICITDEMSISAILFAVYELTLNLGASGLERLTMRENMLVYSFIFSSFILVSFYESIFLTLMLTEPSLRSAYNLQELNASSTKFYSFYDSAPFIKDANLPIIRNELIMNHIDMSSDMSLEMPQDFDKDLVYLVFCSYADSFIKSSLNHHKSQRLFDKIEITQGAQAYTFSSAYFYIEEFKALVIKLIESGIFKYWEMKTLEDVRDKINDEDKTSENDPIEFGGMGVPLSVLMIGLLISLLCLLTELAVYKWQYCFENRFNRVQNLIDARISRKKLKLDNWKTKYLLKKKSLKDILLKKKIKESKSKEYIKSYSNHGHIECRESIKGGYFIFWKIEKLREKRRKIIQVQPCPVENERVAVIEKIND